MLGRISQWTQQKDAATPDVMALNYDREDQLLGAVITPQGGSSASKGFGYEYDAAGNRTSEQLETAPSTFTATESSYNEVNQLNTRSGAGPFAIPFRGKVDEPAVVTVNGQAAKMTQDPNSPSNGKLFSKTLVLPAGNNAVSVVAEDFGTTGQGPNGGNTATKNYTVTVTGGQDKTFNYDDNGNCTGYTTADKTVAYEWDAEDRLVKITQTPVSGPELISEFTYDGFSRWVGIEEKTNGVSGSVKRFIWCGTRVCEERDANGFVIKRFFPEGEQVSGAKYFFTRDHLGSVREMTGMLGSIRARYDYDPYGRRTNAGGDLEADFGFTGHYYHAPSGLHLAVYRAYDADIGRWINRDPIGEDGGLNLYAYVESDTVNSHDPLGFASLNTDPTCAMLKALAERMMPVDANVSWSLHALWEALGCRNTPIPRPIPPGEEPYVERFDPRMNRNWECIKGGPRVQLQPASVGCCSTWEEFGAFGRTAVVVAGCAAVVAAGTIGGSGGCASAPVWTGRLILAPP